MITVLGSINVDLIAEAPRVPTSGEKIMAGPFFMRPGGKGGLQAMAAAKCGAEVLGVFRVGDDEFGDYAARCLDACGVNTSKILVDSDAATGVALIISEAKKYSIVVAPGANDLFTSDEIVKLSPQIKKSKILLLQMEINEQAVLESAKYAHSQGVSVLFNPTPFAPWAKDVIPYATYVVANEEVASLITGIEVNSDPAALAAAETIQSMGTKYVILTMGKKGTIVYPNAVDYKFTPAFWLKNPVDSEGAGDTFIGAFAHAVTQTDIYSAVIYASAAAAISVTRRGASDSQPTGKEVEAFLGENHDVIKYDYFIKNL